MILLTFRKVDITNKLLAQLLEIIDFLLEVVAASADSLGRNRTAFIIDQVNGRLLRYFGRC